MLCMEGGIQLSEEIRLSAFSRLVQHIVPRLRSRAERRQPSPRCSTSPLRETDIVSAASQLTITIPPGADKNPVTLHPAQAESLSKLYNDPLYQNKGEI
jgi:hypothetical protein